MTDGELPPAVGGVLSMMRWRLDLIELAVTSQAEGDPGSRLAEAAGALRDFRVRGAVIGQMLEEAYAAGRADERAEQEDAARARASLRLVRGGLPPGGRLDGEDADRLPGSARG